MIVRRWYYRFPFDRYSPIDSIDLNYLFGLALFDIGLSIIYFVRHKRTATFALHIVRMVDSCHSNARTDRTTFETESVCPGSMRTTTDTNIMFNSSSSPYAAHSRKHTHTHTFVTYCVNGNEPSLHAASILVYNATCAEQT